MKKKSEKKKNEKKEGDLLISLEKIKTSDFAGKAQEIVMALSAIEPGPDGCTVL